MPLDTFFYLSAGTIANDLKLIRLILLKRSQLTIYFYLNIFKSCVEILLHIYRNRFKFVLKGLNFYFVLSVS